MAVFGTKNGMDGEANASPAQINMIGEGAVLEGTFRAAGDLRVSGRVVGKLFVEGRIVITREGVVDGEIEAHGADIAGKMIGQVSVRERLVLKSTANVDGNIKAARLVVEEGAIFGGRCIMGADAMAPHAESIDTASVPAHA